MGKGLWVLLGVAVITIGFIFGFTALVLHMSQDSSRGNSTILGRAFLVESAIQRDRLTGITFSTPPAEGVEVKLYKSRISAPSSFGDYDLVGTMKVVDTGQYWFKNLKEGVYWVGVEPEDKWAIRYIPATGGIRVGDSQIIIGPLLLIGPAP